MTITFKHYTLHLNMDSPIVRKTSPIGWPVLLPLLICFSSNLIVNSQLDDSTTIAPFDENKLVDNATSDIPPPVGLNSSPLTESPSATDEDSPSIPTIVEAMGTTPTNGTPDSIKSKLPKVNFTLVDEIFEAVLSDEEVLKRWKNMDQQLQNGIRTILKMIFPHVVSIQQDAKVSGDCSGGILRWILSLRNLRSWAVKMLDSIGKPSAGIFEGALTMFGNYRQCLSIRAPDDDDIESSDQFEEYFRGQYCIIHLKPWLPAKKPFYGLNATLEQLVRKDLPTFERTLYDELAEIAIAFNFLDIRFDLCVPSTCSRDDIQRVTEYLTKKAELRAKVLRCDIEPHEETATYDRSHFIWAIWTILVILATLTSTIFTIVHKRWTIWCHHQPRNSGLSSEHQNTTSPTPTPAPTATATPTTTTATVISIGGLTSGFNSSRRKSILSSMSITRSLKHFTRIDCDIIQEQKPVALYGLRTVFVYWFMLVEMTVNLNYQFLRESMTLRRLAVQHWPMQILINSTMQYDSLILITAFTFAYSQFDSNIKDHLRYALDKYVRLMPSIMFMVALTILTPLLHIETPVWKDFADEKSQVCQSNGYINVFFLQNFISYPKMCLPQSWLMCVELQLIVLMIPLVLLLKKNFYHNEDRLIVNSYDKVNRQTTRQTNIGFDLSTLAMTLRSSAGLLSMILIACGWFINFFTVYINELPPTWFYTFPDTQQRAYYFGYYLYKTWTHLSTFILGILAGHLCKSTAQIRSVQLIKFINSTPPSSSASSSSSSSSSSNTTNSFNRNAINYNKLVTRSIWLAVATCMMAIIFSTYTWSTQTLPGPFVSALYDATSRCLWSIALIVIMINISLPNPYDNQYSILASILGHNIMIVLGRLSFLAYMIYPFVHWFILSIQEQALYPSLFLIFHVFVGNLVITYFVAFIISILIEQPVRKLITKCFLGNRHCNRKINITTQLSRLSTKTSTPSNQTTTTTTETIHSR